MLLAGSISLPNVLLAQSTLQVAAGDYLTVQQWPCSCPTVLNFTLELRHITRLRSCRSQAALCWAPSCVALPCSCHPSHVKSRACAAAGGPTERPAAPQPPEIMLPVGSGDRQPLLVPYLCTLRCRWRLATV